LLIRLNYNGLGADKTKKHALQHKNACGGQKKVVILQPQTGNKPIEADSPGAGENIDNDATGQTGA
jgi:hypothetical protein